MDIGRLYTQDCKNIVSQMKCPNVSVGMSLHCLTLYVYMYIIYMTVVQPIQLGNWFSPPLASSRTTRMIEAISHIGTVLIVLSSHINSTWYLRMTYRVLKCRFIINGRCQNRFSIIFQRRLFLVVKAQFLIITRTREKSNFTYTSSLFSLITSKSEIYGFKMRKSYTLQ